MKKLIKLAMAGLMVIGLASCGKTSDPVYRTVNFQENFGEFNIFKTVSVLDNSPVERPSEQPVREGYCFENWYTTSSCEVLYDFTLAVTSDLNIYANWVEGATVTFLSDNEIYHESFIPVGSTVGVPEAPTNAYARFDGWYTSDSFVTKFNFGTPITEDLSLFAKWTQTSWSVADKSLMNLYLDGVELPFVNMCGILSNSIVLASTLTTGDDCIYIYNNGDVDVITSTYGTILEAAGYEVSAPEYEGDIGLGYLEDPDTHNVMYVQYGFEPALDETTYGACFILAYVDRPLTEWPAEAINNNFLVEVPEADGDCFRLIDNIGIPGYDYLAVIVFNADETSFEDYEGKLEQLEYNIDIVSETSLVANKTDKFGTIVAVRVNYFAEENALQIQLQNTEGWPTQKLNEYFPTLVMPILPGIYSFQDTMEDEGYVILDVDGYGGEEKFNAYRESLVNDYKWTLLYESDEYLDIYGCYIYEYVSFDGKTLVELYYYQEYSQVRFAIEPFEGGTSTMDVSLVETYFGITVPAITDGVTYINTDAFDENGYVDYIVFGLDNGLTSVNNYVDTLSKAGWEFEQVREGAFIGSKNIDDAISIQCIVKTISSSAIEITFGFKYDPQAINNEVNEMYDINYFFVYENESVTTYSVDKSYIDEGYYIVLAETEDTNSVEDYRLQLEAAGYDVAVNETEENSYVATSSDYAITIMFLYDASYGGLYIQVYGNPYRIATWEYVQKTVKDYLEVEVSIPEPGSQEGYLLDLSYFDEYECITVQISDVGLNDYKAKLTEEGWTATYNSEYGYYDCYDPSGDVEIQLYVDSTGLLTLDIYAAIKFVKWTATLLDKYMAGYTNYYGQPLTFTVPYVEGIDVIVFAGEYTSYGIFDYYIQSETDCCTAFAQALTNDGWTVTSSYNTQYGMTMYQAVNADGSCVITFYFYGGAFTAEVLDGTWLA